jgi:molybdate transport system ATP-binding protein
MNDWRIDVKAELGDFKLSVDVRCKGRVLGLFGPSGSGKSTLVERFAGVQPFHGQIMVDDRSVTELSVGWVPQEGALFPHLSVEENIDYSGKRGVVRDRAVDVLGLSGLLGRSVKGLSGGEIQRVALARALASEPDILILDEPLSGVDLPRRATVFSFLLDVLKQFELPMVYVSHDPAEMLAVVDHVLLLDDGVVVGDGLPSKLLSIPTPSHWLSN